MTTTPTPDVPIERLFAIDWWAWKAREPRPVVAGRMAR